MINFATEGKLRTESLLRKIDLEKYRKILSPLIVTDRAPDDDDDDNDERQGTGNNGWGQFLFRRTC